MFRERNPELALFLQTAEHMLPNQKLMSRETWRNLARLHACDKQEAILTNQRQRLSQAIARIVFTFGSTLYRENLQKMEGSIVVKTRKERVGYNPLFAEGLPNVSVAYNVPNAENVTLQYIPYPSVSGSITSSISFREVTEGAFDFVPVSKTDTIPLMGGLDALPFMEREHLINIVSLVSNMICARKLRSSLQVIPGDV